MKNKLYLILSIVIILSCKSTNQTISKKQANFTMEKIIKDYFKSNKKYINSYNIFEIEEKKEFQNQEILVFSIGPITDDIPYIVQLEDSLNYKNLPTHYLEYKNKLFLWRQGNQKTPDSVMQYIYNKKIVDSSYLKYKMGIIPEEEIQEIIVTKDDDIKRTNYVFCRNNLSKIRKKTLSTGYTSQDNEKLKKIKCKS